MPWRRVCFRIPSDISGRVGHPDFKLAGKRWIAGQAGCLAYFKTSIPVILGQLTHKVIMTVIAEGIGYGRVACDLGIVANRRPADYFAKPLIRGSLR